MWMWTTWGPFGSSMGSVTQGPVGSVQRIAHTKTRLYKYYRNTLTPGTQSANMKNWDSVNITGMLQPVLL